MLCEIFKKHPSWRAMLYREAIHAVPLQRTPMDCHASVKSFEARNDDTRVAITLIRTPSLRAMLYQRSNPYSCHHSERRWIATPDKLFEIHAMTALIEHIA
jgi:hypothetical protein